jgi:hypothetical protein
MPPSGPDTNTANLVAAIAACLAAFASSISVIISAKALSRTTKQTEILAAQFERAELARVEAGRPRLTVEISKYQPPDSGQMRGDVTFTVRNAGQVGFRLVGLRSQSGDTQNQDVPCSVEIHPGYPEAITVNILPPGNYNPPALKAWLEIETPGGARYQHAAEWELRRSRFVVLKSETAGE